ncbi:carbohydrate-binding module family 43 protein [Durotheca rogersii]|uniref:carbohydrate-binding module family 43 protein n=1 Tax=Durotheca rogersii TaxID=419775 RepID=UPI0022203B2E|nr:carbohydrate-binding module family 43 protein [Durotheca rogersii]KAI5865235.1 carbohydrate-binding module family 43 protein [Durotheca rogersii]
MGFLQSAVTASLALSGSATALEPIVQKGTKFFTESGKQFFMKGVAYQQEAGGGPAGTKSTTTTYVDPLADAKVCQRDVPLLENLGINTIRTYAIDPEADHDACMALLDKAGIYVVADLGEPALSINRDDPAWNVELFDRYKAVIDNLSKYDNVIGFFSGNEVTNNASNTDASAYVKAATRDTKKYIADKQANGGRWMGVGYAANDDADIRVSMAQYFNCGNQEEAIDFWGYNIYSWCGKSSFTESGFDVQVEFFSNYSVPVFFAEYGCNEPGGAEGRLWDDTTAIYSDQMTGVFSGGLVYMFHQEENDYGLVQISGNTAKTLKNYDVLKTKLAAVSPSSTSINAYTPTNSPAACPAITENWKVAEALPPTPDSSLCSCMTKAASCVPASDLQAEEYGQIFGYICANDPAACAGIKHDTETGVYGPYGMCNPVDQLAHVLDSYYKNQNSASDACNFNGAAKLVQGSVASSCQSALSQAESSIAVAATATAGASTSGSGSGTTENAAAPASVRFSPLMTMGDMAISLYVLVAMGVGAGMVML